MNASVVAASTLLKETVDGNANSALEVKGIRGVLESQSVSSALGAPVVECRISPSVL